MKSLSALMCSSFLLLASCGSENEGSQTHDVYGDVANTIFDRLKPGLYVGVQERDGVLLPGVACSVEVTPNGSERPTFTFKYVINDEQHTDVIEGRKFSGTLGGSLTTGFWKNLSVYFSDDLSSVKAFLVEQNRITSIWNVCRIQSVTHSGS